MLEFFRCCFCGKECEGFGNNPAPANPDENARCCDECNLAVVFPARLKLHTAGALSVCRPFTNEPHIGVKAGEKQ